MEQYITIISKPEVQIFQFAKDTKTKIEDLIDTKVYNLNKKALSNPSSLSREEKDYIVKQIHSSTYTFGNTMIPVLGYAFDFSDVLKKFVIKTRSGEYQVVNGIDKTSVRNCFNNVKAIEEIHI